MSNQLLAQTTQGNQGVIELYVVENVVIIFHSKSAIHILVRILLFQKYHTLPLMLDDFDEVTVRVSKLIVRIVVQLKSNAVLFQI